MKSETRRHPQSARRIAIAGEVFVTFAARVVHTNTKTKTNKRQL
jgi:hypothetical protein